MLCSILSLRAQTFVKPAVKVKDTSFAVITDKGTFQACEAELKAYQEILGMEGLPTFIVYNEWNKPEDVKKALNPQLHSRSATYIKRNGLLIRKITIKSSRPFQCAYHPLTP